MSQSLLYHAFGIPKTYRYVRTEYAQGAIWFTVRPEGEPECCPHCRGKEFVGHGQRERQGADGAHRAQAGVAEGGGAPVSV